MPPHWDTDSPKLRQNLSELLQSVGDYARNRNPLLAENARHWHVEMMKGLQADDPKYIGAFRGEAGLEIAQVYVWDGTEQLFGVEASEVAASLRGFEQTLQSFVSRLDEMVAHGAEPTKDQSELIVKICAWTHAEWVRIHPFVNGNGRTARLWVHSLVKRYRLPSFMRLRPRPRGDYVFASIQAMRSDAAPTEAVFLQMLNDYRE